MAETAQGGAAADGPGPLQRAAWAPGTWAMLVWTALMVVLFTFGAAIASSIGLPNPEGGAVLSFGGLVLTGYMAHRSYQQARKALAADSSLRGAWAVDNAWWLVPFLGVVTPIVILVLSVATA